MGTAFKIKKKANLFGSIVKWFSKGNEDKEIFWWDMFFRYEVTIGISVGAIIASIVSLIIYPIIGGDTIMQIFDMKEINVGKFILIILVDGVLFSLILAWLMVFPLYTFYNGTPHKRLEIGPARVGFVNILSACGIVVLLYAIARLIYKNIYITMTQGIIIAIVFIILFVIVAINAASYCNWRFDWAIENQDTIYSRHYKYWTSGSEFASERFQWKYLRWYKMMVAIVLLAGPTILATSFICTHHSKHERTTQNEMQSSQEPSLTVTPTSRDASTHRGASRRDNNSLNETDITENNVSIDEAEQTLSTETPPQETNSVGNDANIDESEQTQQEVSQETNKTTVGDFSPA